MQGQMAPPGARGRRAGEPCNVGRRGAHVVSACQNKIPCCHRCSPLENDAATRNRHSVYLK
ncbi:hypothetical protein BGY98DRAFT_984826 [Russula aff. rugulosa BPL654]|nr:hypothetical protein BGY98DRAFT_984826 [Russula aff. rugulosa BPL654]